MDKSRYAVKSDLGRESELRASLDHFLELSNGEIYSIFDLAIEPGDNLTMNFSAVR